MNVYTLTTITPQMGYTDFDVRTLNVTRDVCVLRCSGPAADTSVITRERAALVLRTWREWARTCPDQEVTVERYA